MCRSSTTPIRLVVFYLLGLVTNLVCLTATHASGSLSSVVTLAGWHVLPTHSHFPDLVARLEASVTAHGMNLVNAASASEGAKAQGITIPGNRVIGVFRNDFARRLLAASLAAGLEAPIRFYVTENPDHTATLSYRTPSNVFAPYMQDGGADLHILSLELDTLFDAIAQQAVRPQ